MADRVLLAQLSDLHVGDAGAAERVADAVRAVLALDTPPDAVLVTGDVAENGTPEEYEQARELLAPLPMPVHVLAGNHDDPDVLRERFGLPGRAGEPLQHEARVGGLRVLLCDTTRRGAPDGALGPERLAWIEARLGEEPEAPVLLALHHTPLLTGVALMDALGLADADRDALAALVARHPQVRATVGGHVHRTAVAELGGRPLLACPSTHLQLRLDLAGAHDDLALVPEQAGFALHLADGDALTSLVLPVDV